jgi:hypothetical protein
MSIVELRYFRATCDKEGCKKYINVACEFDPESLAACLRSNKWRVDDGRHDTPRPYGQVHCPEHATNGQ